MIWKGTLTKNAGVGGLKDDLKLTQVRENIFCSNWSLGHSRDNKPMSTRVAANSFSALSPSAL